LVFKDDASGILTDKEIEAAYEENSPSRLNARLKKLMSKKNNKTNTKTTTVYKKPTQQKSVAV